MSRSNWVEVSTVLPSSAMTTITDDEELFLLTVPVNVHQDMMMGTPAKICIDKKCKIRINGETYVGAIHHKRVMVHCSNKESNLSNTLKIDGQAKLHKSKKRSKRDSSPKKRRRSFEPEI